MSLDHMDDNEIKYAAIRAAQIEEWNEARTTARLAREFDILDVEARRITRWVFAPLKHLHRGVVRGEEKRRMRREKGLSLEKLAELSGTAWHTIINWENNKHIPQERTRESVLGILR